MNFIGRWLKAQMSETVSAPGEALPGSYIKLRAVDVDELADTVIRLLCEDPTSWEFNGYSAKRGTFSLWIENRPYRDLTTMSLRLGTTTQKRDELRAAIDSAIAVQIAKELGVR